MADSKQKKPSQTKSPWVPGIIGGLLGAALVGGVGAAILGTDDEVTYTKEEVSSLVNAQVASQVSTQFANQESSASTQETALNIQTDVSKTVASVQGAVVSVVNLANMDGVYDLFGFTTPGVVTDENSEANYETASEGSGVIYKVEGDTAYIVTNNHVIEGSDALEIILSDGKQVSVEVVGTDIWTDLAVLAMPAEYATTVAEFGDSTSLTVGEPVIAIGSPLGSEFASTVTKGIISGLDRSVPTDLNGDGVADWQVTAIQTDAAINPGNSGGALVNAGGQIIGINSMKISTDSVEGMGFAIPSNDVKTVIADLEEFGKVVRPELGITMASLHSIPLEQQKQLLKLDTEIEGGVVVVEAAANSPAANGGIRPNDVIVKFNGTDVNNIVELRQALFGADANATVEVELYRNGEQQTIKVKLQPQKTNIS